MRPPAACLTREGKSGKIAASDPPGTSLGEVLSRRVFDLGKGAQRSEVPLDRKRSGGSLCRCDKTRTEDSERASLKADSRREPESDRGRLSGNRSADGQRQRSALFARHSDCKNSQRWRMRQCVGKRSLRLSLVGVRVCFFPVGRGADTESKLSRTWRAISGSNWPGSKRREVLRKQLPGITDCGSGVPYSLAVGGPTMISVQGAVVGGNDVGFQKAGCQG